MFFGLRKSTGLRSILKGFKPKRESGRNKEKARTQRPLDGDWPCSKASEDRRNLEELLQRTGYLAPSASSSERPIGIEKPPPSSSVASHLKNTIARLVIPKKLTSNKPSQKCPDILDEDI